MMGLATTRGRIGVVATVDSEETMSTVWFWASLDGGETWLDPVKVSTGPPEGSQYDAYLAADPLGGWHAAWMWALPASFAVDAYYSHRAPGSDPWSAPARVNPVPGAAIISVGASLSIAADGDGHAYIAYQDEKEDRTFWLVTTRPRPWDGLDGTDWFVVSPLSLAGARARVRFSTPDPTAVSTLIVDARGRRVARWPERVYPRGIHTLEWDGTTASGARTGSGVYFWRFEYAIEGRIRRATTQSVLVR